MWISKAHYAVMNGLIESAQERNTEMLRREGERQRLTIENERLRSDLDWFKLRLNQVERERGQLIQASIGVKISVPEFVPSEPETDESLHQMPNFATVGGDALPEGTTLNAGEDYSGMPGYKGNK